MEQDARKSKIKRLLDEVKRQNKSLDVSNVDDNLRFIEKISTPKTDRSGKKGVQGLPIVSDNYDAYKFIMDILGKSYSKYSQAYYDHHGYGTGTTNLTQSGSLSPRVARATRTRVTPHNIVSPKNIPSPRKTQKETRSKSPVRSPVRSSKLSVNPAIKSPVRSRIKSSLSNAKRDVGKKSPIRMASKKRTEEEISSKGLNSPCANRSTYHRCKLWMKLRNIEDDKVVDVSNMGPEGQRLRIIDVPGERSLKVGFIEELPIVSNNFESYQRAIDMIDKNKYKHLVEAYCDNYCSV